MTRTEFIQNMQTGRRQWQQLWKSIDLFGTSRPRTPGEMSLRDILFHIAWYEREMVEMLQLRALVGSSWWELPVDERNAHIQAEAQSASLLQAWRLEQQMYTELMSQLQSIRDEELGDARFFQEMPSDWIPWQVIASNSYEHYAEHYSGIY